MALSYSLKYKKLNFGNRVLIEKEGEIIIDRQSFRLKGKGAQDVGEIIYFSDIRDLFLKQDHLMFTTYAKEKYVLMDFANLFDSFLKDFLRIRNEYLEDVLFMKVGTLVNEYEGNVELITTNERVIPKGKCRIRIYEGSVVFIPEIKDAFVIYFNFLKGHEFDESEFKILLLICRNFLLDLMQTLCLKLFIILNMELLLIYLF